MTEVVPDEVLTNVALELLLTDEQAAPAFAAARHPVRDEAEAAALLEGRAEKCIVCGMWMYPEAPDADGTCKVCAAEGKRRTRESLVWCGFVREGLMDWCADAYEPEILWLPSHQTPQGED